MTEKKRSSYSRKIYREHLKHLKNLERSNAVTFAGKIGLSNYPTLKGDVMKIQSSTTMLAGISLCAGAVIGLGTGVLLAPRSGERTRRKIRDFVKDAAENLVENRRMGQRSVTRFFNRVTSYSGLQPQKPFLENFRLKRGWLNRHSKQRKSMVM